MMVSEILNASAKNELAQWIEDATKSGAVASNETVFALIAKLRGAPGKRLRLKSLRWMTFGSRDRRAACAAVSHPPCDVRRPTSGGVARPPSRSHPAGSIQ